MKISNIYTNENLMKDKMFSKFASSIQFKCCKMYTKYRIQLNCKPPTCLNHF